MLPGSDLLSTYLGFPIGGFLTARGDSDIISLPSVIPDFMEWAEPIWKPAASAMGCVGMVPEDTLSCKLKVVKLLEKSLDVQYWYIIFY